MVEINGLGAALPESPEAAGSQGQEIRGPDEYADDMPLPESRRANIFTHNILTRKSFGKIFEQNKRGIFEVHYRTAQNTTSQGTGYIVNKRRNEDGSFTYHLWTNAHVVFNTIEVLLDTSKVTEYTYYELRNATDPEHSVTVEDVNILNIDVVLDLAVISFTSREDFPVCRLAEAADPQTLDPVLLIGNTSGTGISVNEGKIKQPSTGMSDYSFRTFQHDAEVTGGNSGSPIFNRWGEVIGTHFRSIERIIRYGFTVDDAYESYAKMLEHPGQWGVSHGDWGITIKEMEAFERQERFQSLPERYQQAGVKVVNVSPNSVAARAGVQPGDDILAINGNTEAAKIESNFHLYRFYEVVRRSHEGERYTLTINRNGQVFDVDLTAKETLYRPPEVFETKRGFKVLDFPVGYREINGIPEDVQGVLAVMDNAMDGDDDTNTNIPFLNRSIILGIHIQTEDGGTEYFPTPNVEEFKKIYQGIPRGTQFCLVYQATASNFYGGAYHSDGLTGVSYQIFD